MLELVHLDVCGPMSTQVRGGYEYFITFTDDYSRFGYVYLMKRKSETFEKFKEFKAKVENQLGKCIKAIRSDRDGEYLLRDFKDYLTENGIISTNIIYLSAFQQLKVDPKKLRPFETPLLVSTEIEYTQRE